MTSDADNGRFVLRVTHSVPDFDRWKAAFDSDPVDRRGGKVRGYTVHRSVPESDLVHIDLTFDTVEDADAFAARLRGLWDGPGAAVMRNPTAHVVERVEAQVL